PPRARGVVGGRLPPPERVLRADAEARDDQHDPRRRWIDEWKQQIAALETEDRSAFEKERQGGPGPARDVTLLRRGHAPQLRQPTNGSDTVAAAPAEAGLDRNPLREVQRHPPGTATLPPRRRDTF